MEKEAFNRFNAVADKENIHFIAKEERFDIPLIIVEVEGVGISDD